VARNLPEVVFLTREDSPIHPVAETILRNVCTIKRVPTPGWSFDESVLQNVVDANAILVRVGVVTKEVMYAAPNLKLVAVHGIGVDRVDIEEALKRGIMVTNTPLANTAAVAEHALALILGLIKKIPTSDRLVKEGKWTQAHSENKQLMNMTTGIIGLGNIGTKVAKRLRSFETRIIAYDPYVPAERFEELGVESVNLENLLKTSDVVTIHLPLTRFTKHLIKEEQLKKMKTNAHIVNTSRGPVIDEKALYIALRDKWIASAALDVFEEEPLPQNSPLLKLENIILTPHVAGSTDEANRRMAETNAKDIARVLKGEKPVHEYRRELLPYPV
jgi:D-3-phosphoglycerate dehydrogenase